MKKNYKKTVVVRLCIMTLLFSASTCFTSCNKDEKEIAVELGELGDLSQYVEEEEDFVPDTTSSSGGDSGIDIKTIVEQNQTFVVDFEGTLTDTKGSIRPDMYGYIELENGARKSGLKAYKGNKDSYLVYDFPSSIQTPEMTISVWSKAISDNAKFGIITAVENDRKNGVWILQENKTDGKVCMGYGSGERWLEKGALTHNEWNHLVYTTSASGSAYYANGELVKTTSKVVDWTGVSKMTVGSSGSHNYWGHKTTEGYIDDIKFLKKALTAEEVKALYSYEK